MFLLEASLLGETGPLLKACKVCIPVPLSLQMVSMLPARSPAPRPTQDSALALALMAARSLWVSACLWVQFPGQCFNFRSSLPHPPAQPPLLLLSRVAQVHLGSHQPASPFKQMKESTSELRALGQRARTSSKARGLYPALRCPLLPALPQTQPGAPLPQHHQPEALWLCWAERCWHWHNLKTHPPSHL